MDACLERIVLNVRDVRIKNRDRDQTLAAVERLDLELRRPDGEERGNEVAWRDFGGARKRERYVVGWVQGRDDVGDEVELLDALGEDELAA